MQLQENALFDRDRYRLIRLLGRGGFSEVWLAEDTKTGLHIALKIYAPGTGLDEDGVKLFSHEFSLVFNFNHPNLLKPSYYDVCDRMPYLIMPYCEQGSANKLIDNITEEEAWKFLHDVSAGLAYLHNRQPDPVIHQDIKPGNILMDDSRTFFITDFGISTKARNTLRMSKPKHGSSGTLAYMGPERFGKDNMPIKAGDIWALGATLYELLCGVPPFGEHGGLIQKSEAEIPNIPGKWSRALTSIVELCLQKDPWQRPTAEQIVAWTNRHAQGEKIHFKHNTPATKTRKRGIGWIVAICILILAIAGGIFWQKQQEEQQLYESFLTYKKGGDRLYGEGEAHYKQALYMYNEAAKIAKTGKITRFISSDDIHEKCQHLAIVIDSLFDDYVQRGQRLLQQNNPVARRQAIANFQEALLFKDDTLLMQKLNQL
ncbi:MAG: serine/threonine protein kinase [Odoribacteraceae bacterium]|jgi:serine/threonine protein kinase|nr:serine/threonine protein kinase [Odoribacteraceae bacterium]